MGEEERRAVQIQKLKHFMPLSGPGQRTPVRGDESPFRVSLGFTPAWFHRRLQIDFSERWHKDPVYRYGTMLQMRREVHRLFPDMEDFQLKWNEKGAEVSCATISGVYGVCPMGAVYGLPVIFGKDTWPDTVDHYTKKEISAWKPINLQANGFVQELLEQMERLEETYGQIDGYLHYQGILNTAFRLMGQEIFLEMMEDEPFAVFLFDHIYETTLGLVKLVQSRQKKAGFTSDLFTMADCTINLIGTELYEKILLPYEQKMEQEFAAYGVHTCNFDVTRFFPALQKLKNLGYLDMGMMSDMKQAREAFPQARLAVIYHPNFIANKPLELVKEDFEKIRREAAPCDLMLVDMGPDISDERLFQVVDLARQMEAEARNLNLGCDEKKL